MLKRYKINF